MRSNSADETSALRKLTAEITFRPAADETR